MPALISLIALSLCFFFLALDYPVFADDNLLVNSDFEDDDISSDWLKNYSTLGLSATDSSTMVYSGKKAVLLKSTSTSTKYIYQTISASGSGSYNFSGFAKIISGNVQPYLRLSWYLSADGTGSELGHTDSKHLSDIGPEFENLSLATTIASGANSLRVKASLEPADPLLSLVVFDNLYLKKENPANNTQNQTMENSAEKEITFNLPGVVTAGQEFSVKITLTGFAPNQKYLFKSLAGLLEDNALYSATTQGAGSNWHAWNSSWNNMPDAATDSRGNASIEIKSRIADTFSGSLSFLIRVRNVDSGENLDSEAKVISVAVKQDPAGENNDPPVSDINPTSTLAGINVLSTNSATATDDAYLDILGTQSARMASQSSLMQKKFSRQTELNENRNLNKMIAPVLIGSGSLLLGVSGYLMYNQKKKSSL